MQNISINIFLPSLKKVKNDWRRKKVEKISPKPFYFVSLKVAKPRCPSRLVFSSKFLQEVFQAACLYHSHSACSDFLGEKITKPTPPPSKPWGLQEMLHHQPSHTSLPTDGPHRMDKPWEQLGRALVYSPLSSGTVKLLKQSEVVILLLFLFSQGFPKWMAVKDFNILQAQQLILKSLAEGFYRGKLGCKSFWRLFPFWNL